LPSLNQKKDGSPITKQPYCCAPCARIGDIKKGFAAACKRAGLEGVTPHVLKHTTASWIIQSGSSFDEAAEFLATSAKVLRETYAHLHPEHQQGVADALSS
jgi:integrase